MELKVHNERNAFREKLGPFPHLFQLVNYGRLSAAKLRDIRDRLQRERGERAVDSIPDVERHRDSNFIAFIAFLLGDYEETKRETEAVLKENPHNLVACGNLAVFTWEKLGSETDVEKIFVGLQHLQRDISFNQRRREATAEIAYCYSRMGPGYLELARQTFLTVVEEMPENYDAKLGLAMVLRRSTSRNSRICHRIDHEESERRKADAEKLLQCIIHSPDACWLVKAQAAAEFGMVQSEHYKKFSPAVKVFEYALQFAPKEVSVLDHAAVFYRRVRCGSHYRQQNLNRSRQLLEEAVKIRPTTTVHHNLGLTLRKLAEEGLQRGSSRKRKLGASDAFVVRLSRYDENVKAAEMHFRQAINISHEQNTSASMDLANLLIDIGEEAEGIKQLQRLLSQETYVRSPIDFIRAHELAGMFKLWKGRKENNPRRKTEQEEDGRKLLHIALNRTEEVSFTSHEIRESDSYKALLHDLQSNDSVLDRLRKEAAIRFTGAEYSRVLNILNMPNSQQLLKDTEFHEMRLACFVKLGMFQQAMSFLALISADDREFKTDNYKNTQLPVQACILAMREQLHFGNTNSRSATKAYCQTAFRLTFHQNERQYEMQRSGCTGEADEELHATIIYDIDDPSLEFKVTRLKYVLSDVCGLQVFCVGDEHPGKYEMSAVLDSVWRSQVLVVLTGDKDMSEEFLDMFLRPSLPAKFAGDSRCQGVVIIRAGNDEQLLPKELRNSGCYRQWNWMSALMEPIERDQIGKTHVDCICDLICFMLDTNVDNLTAEKK